MNEYTLLKREASGTAIVAIATAGTQKQAQRRLYRGAGLTEATAQAQGYTVQFNPPAKPIKAVQKVANVIF